MSVLQSTPELTPVLPGLYQAPHVRVLTLTPFYPNQANPAQGCFIAEPLHEMERLGVITEVFAAQPFYRGPVQNLSAKIKCEWDRHFCLPGNFGLYTAGAFLAGSVSQKIRSAHQERPFDLIHAHAALPCGHAAMIISRQLGIPYVVSAHGLDVFSTHQVKGRFGSWCEKLSTEVYRNAQRVVCVSEGVRRQVEAKLSVRTVVVYNGVDTRRFSPGHESDPPVVLSVGNLIPTKGQAALLRAFANLLLQVPGCVLEIIGEGPERGALEQLAEDLHIASQIRFQGRQTRNEVASAMRQCAIFALPSYYEALGCVYLEAMASGKAVIACQGQGIAEIIAHGRNGWLISPGNEAELANALTALLKDREFRDRLGSSARETVVSKHTLSFQAKQLADVYRECVK